jgi:hypothetical protein
MKSLAIPTNCRFFEFALLKAIAPMLCDNRALPAEQFSHLMLGQPNRFLFKMNLQA